MCKMLFYVEKDLDEEIKYGTDVVEISSVLRQKCNKLFLFSLFLYLEYEAA